jgi:AcrR family transcriptional regulator
MATPQPAAKPRKVPAQKRSQATVDAIIQASTYILMKSGWGGFTTNAIAERAGVNISSLYQFFKNKEAIIAEIQRRHAEETRADLHEVLQNLPEQSTFRETLTLLVQVLIKKHQVAPEVHKVLMEEIPRTARCVLDEDAARREQLLSKLHPFMKNIPDPDLAIYVIGIAMDAIIHQITTSRPSLLDEERLVTELVTLLERYLCRPE